MNKNQDSGFVIASLVISMTFVLLIMVSIFVLVTNTHKVGAGESFRINAQFAADAGVDSAISELNLDPGWTGTGGEVTVFDDSGLRTTFEVTVTDGVSSSEKIVRTTGRSFRPPDLTNAESTRSYEVDLRSLGDVGGTFAIVTGVGGLVMQNSAKILDGDVYVNGSITLSNKTQIGSSINSVSVRAAHGNCPASGGPTYPTACGPSDGQPISTQNQATIYGEVCANNQTNASGIDTSGTNGLYEVGTDPECGTDDPLPTLDLPDHDRATQVANVAFEAGVNTAQSASWYQDCDTNNSSGKRTWQGPLKINGDVEIGKKCEITIVGDVWITGNLELSSSAKIIVSDSIALGGTNTINSEYPTVMVDGSSGIVFSNSSEAVGNSSDVGAQFITYWSDAGCSPDCTTVTGSDLLDSSTTTTISLRNSAKAPNSILFSKWSQVDLNNGGDVGALVGQTVLLRNSAAVTFGASVGGGGSASNPIWLVQNYRRVF